MSGAKNSNTSRHLAEFWTIEPEIAFADLSDNAALAEALLKYTFDALLNERQEDLAFFDQRIEKGLVARLEEIVGSEFVQMEYGEAIVGDGLGLARGSSSPMMTANGNF